MTSPRVRVRFAPSPTGPLHMGGVRTALYNYLFAKKNGGDFLIRIEDTDQTRYVPGAEQYILDSLKWCGIEPTEGVGYGGKHEPYRQSERKPMYKAFALDLIEKGWAYYAFDTPEELDNIRKQAELAKMPNWQYNSISRMTMKNSLTLPADEVAARLEKGDPFVVRFKMPRNEEVRFQDIIRGWVVFSTNELDDKVLYKSDGMPTYHLANIVDDHTMEISHVIRGEEWLPSAPLHVMMYRAFEWEAPLFAHLPLILKPDGNGKLSKRDGDRLGFPVFPLQWTDPETGNISSGYRESGYLPKAFINMLLLLGWAPSNNQEIFTLDEMVEAFTIERVGKSGSKFDPEKTKWFNQQYMRNTPRAELAEMIMPAIQERGYDVCSEYVEGVIELMLERAVFPKDLLDGEYLFVDPTSYDEDAVAKKWKAGESAAILQKWAAVLETLEPFTVETIDAAMKQFLADNNVGMGAVMPLFRLALTGVLTGPGASHVAALVGKEFVLPRIQKCIDTLG
ncbi:MAG: glutamate--tRNA ligase [Flavobacteriales bacterium]|nr:glutamate--tRNA ligase [Flavobacteriales bacterium]MDP4716806.1 glutamate--tRNA ligase [Flavobacteriales bacterium]MDP4731757.1 glutamate--tRNA ligase [Flavobacteriales bacterium]MDP4819319.1 glutamate--tRNA ligase [Flavobacteriales bacterium]MDP4951624.1 glutamate--tRNA ligase [Flavobacteriales bacterium]